MDLLNSLLRFEGGDRIALIVLAIAATAWLTSMIAALVAKKAAGSGIRRIEIAVAVLSLALLGSMTHLGRTLTAAEQPEVTAPTPSGGTGTCASVRAGMSAAEVRSLLGTPSLEQKTEDARGPGAEVMVFDDSRCMVHLMDGVVDLIE